MFCLEISLPSNCLALMYHHKRSSRKSWAVWGMSHRLSSYARDHLYNYARFLHPRHVCRCTSGHLSHPTVPCGRIYGFVFLSFYHGAGNIHYKSLLDKVLWSETKVSQKKMLWLILVLVGAAYLSFPQKIPKLVLAFPDYLALQGLAHFPGIAVDSNLQ